MTKPVKLYVIYYGSWKTDQIEKINYFLNNLGKSDWYAINRKYYQVDAKGKKTYISDQMSIAKSVIIPGTMETIFSKLPFYDDYSPIITEQLKKKVFPEDEDALYAILTPFLTNSYFCGIHDYYKRGNKNLKWFYAGLGSKGSGCDSPGVNPVNGGLDNLLSTAAHEIVEATSDPQLTGWIFQKNGDFYWEENADLCSWDYKVKKLHKGLAYNTIIGGRKYYIQSNYDPITKTCEIGLTKKPIVNRLSQIRAKASDSTTSSEPIKISVNATQSQNMTQNQTQSVQSIPLETDKSNSGEWTGFIFNFFAMIEEYFRR